jgi:transglutaminase-like putative cysteine protease
MFSALGCGLQGDPPDSASTSPDAFVTVVGQREYVVRQQLTLVNEGSGVPEKQNIWVALIRDFAPYQDVLSMEISPRDYQSVTDEYGNQYAEFDFSKQPAGTSKSIQIEYRVIVYELVFDLANCEGELLDEYTRSELHIEADNPQIMSLSNELARGKKTVCEQVRAFYDYIGNELVYGYNGENWGAQAALGRMGADCTEYASLLVALSRAQGIPARYFEGLRYLDQEEDATERIEHAWPDVYMPGLGWMALDPTLGRSMLTREAYFAHYTPEHIIVSLGASPSTLRGSNYWTHLYWPGDSTNIRVQASAWEIDLVGK